MYTFTSEYIYLFSIGDVIRKGLISVEKALGYVRVSTAEQVREGTSLDDQEARIRAYCEMNGLNLVTMIREEGVSAAKLLANDQVGTR